MGVELRTQNKGKLGLPVRPESLEKMCEQVLTVQEIQNSSSKFVTCHRYIGNSVTSSSPAHWHREIEIMHFVSGQGFSHTCQCKGETFDAPAIVLVPSDLIHRTCYAPECKVNRILFKSDSLRLRETDKALESFLTQLNSDDARGSIIIRNTDPGFDELVKALTLIEELGDTDESQTYDPSKAQEDSIKQDKVEAYVSATFANTGFKSGDQLGMLTESQNSNGDYGRTLGRRGRRSNTDLYEDSLHNINQEQSRSLYSSQYEQNSNSSMAINAGSIAIALAQNFKPGVNASKGKSADNLLQIADIISNKKNNPVDNFRQQGLNLQFKAFLLNFIGKLAEHGYFSENRNGRRTRNTRYNDEKIKILLKHIHDNYNRPMNITELARMLNVTNQYFCRYFKQLTDMSFIDYLNDLRLQKAAQEIATTQQSIREISTKHGFDTIGYFFKLFRERYNTTPIGYRSRFNNPNNAVKQEQSITDTPAYEPFVVRRRRRAEPETEE